MLSRLEAFADYAYDWIDAQPGRVVAGFSLLYFFTFCLLANHRRFWFDELFTLYLTAQPTFADVLARLSENMDQQPPLYYLIHRPLLALSSAGDPQLAMRIPAMFGVWLACVCLFRIVQKRTSTVYGLLAMLALLLTPANIYASEARPYGLVLGFTALALLAYQNIVDDRHRPLMLALMGLALFAAVSSSYYAVLGFAALAFAEAVRILLRRRIDWGVAASLGLSAAMVSVYAPFVASSVGGFEANNWASPYLGEILNEYVWMIGRLDVPLIVCLCAWGIYRLLSSNPASEEPPAAAWPRPFIDIAAATGLLLLPFWQYAVAKTVTNKMTGRYVLPATIGLSILIAFTVYSTGRLRKAAGLLVVISLAASLLVAKTVPAIERLIRGPRHAPPPVANLLRGQRTDLPVVVDSPMNNLVWSHRNWNGIRERLYYLVDPLVARRITTDIVDDGSQWLRYSKHMPVQAVLRQQFLREHPEFYLYYEGPFQAYILAATMQDGASIELAARNFNQELFLVRYLPTPSASHSGSSP